MPEVELAHGPQTSPVPARHGNPGGTGMEDRRSPKGHGPMMACCALMVAGAGVAAYGSWNATGAVGWTRTVLPILACAGLHLVLHRVACGRSRALVESADGRVVLKNASEREAL